MTGITRREAVASAAFAALAPLSARGQAPHNLLLVHGRAQGARDAAEVRAEWLAALREGAERADLPMPDETNVELPFFGKRLDELVELSKVETAGRITQKGGREQDGYLEFQAELAEEMRQDLGITDAEIDAIYGDDPREKGPQNWRWVHAIVRAIDARSDTLSAAALELVTRDVFLYLELDRIREEIDSIVSAALTDAPTVVVGHSLGSVVAFNVLRSRRYQVPLLVTLGSPLGINAVRRRLAPIAYPGRVGEWHNFFDDRDIVALRPLDATYFPVDPAVQNFPAIKNSTDNRHGISGYLNTAEVARSVLGTAR